MSDKGFNTEKIVLHWIESSDEDFNTALTLFQNNLLDGLYLLVIFLLKNY